MSETIWLGLELTKEIEENEVSRWADKNSIPGVYPARIGWTPITSTQRGWFSGGCIACGGGFDVPGRIFHGKIAIDGFTKE